MAEEMSDFPLAREVTGKTQFLRMRDRGIAMHALLCDRIGFFVKFERAGASDDLLDALFDFEPEQGSWNLRDAADAIRSGLTRRDLRIAERLFYACIMTIKVARAGREMHGFRVRRGKFEVHIALERVVNDDQAFKIVGVPYTFEDMEEYALFFSMIHHSRSR